MKNFHLWYGPSSDLRFGGSFATPAEAEAVARKSGEETWGITNKDRRWVMRLDAL